MPVIGGRELGFRVNVRPTNSDVAPENYGFTICQPCHRLAGDEAGLPKATFESCRMKSKAIEDRAGGMANRIFPRLPCRRRFESMPAAATSKTRIRAGINR
jgi:hypothetical protein